MQVKKFEAPTIQEALDHIKRELGPEAIILQTKKHKRGFGLMSKSSVEVTAAVSDRSIQKKKFVESRLPEPTRASVDKLGAERQAEFIDGYVDRHLEQAAARTQDSVSMQTQSAPSVKKPPARQSALAAAAKDASAIARAAAVGRPGTAGAIAAGVQTPAYGPNAAQRLNQSRRYVEIDAHELKDTGEGTTSPVPPAPAAKLSSALSVEQELTHIKRMMSEMQATREDVRADPQGVLGTPALQDAFEQLVLGGVDRRYAHALIKQASFSLGAEASKNPDEVLDQVAAEILGNVSTRSPLSEVQQRKRDPETGAVQGDGPRVIALTGPTGVGKTTTIAKLASQAALKRGLRVGLISLDSGKTPAFDALQSFAKILNAPYRQVQSTDELQAAIRDYRALDLVFVDTAGRTQRGAEGYAQLRAQCASLDGVSGEAQIFLVLSATTRDADLYEAANRFGGSGIVITKLDEAASFGGIYNVACRSKQPLLYFTTGPKVPEDIEDASRERLAALVMDL